MGTIYTRNPAIRDTLNAIQKRQVHNLKYRMGGEQGLQAEVYAAVA